LWSMAMSHVIKLGIFSQFLTELKAPTNQHYLLYSQHEKILSCFLYEPNHTRYMVLVYL